MATAHAGSEPGARFVRLSVDPACRRVGVGRLLFEAVRADLLRDGCRTAEAMVVAGSAGEAFAIELGAAVGDELVDAVLSFEAVDWPELRQLGGPPPGYVLLDWAGRAPDRLVESYARAKRSNAPNRHPPTVLAWDIELVRAHERALADRQAELWVTAAVLAGTGAVAASGAQAPQDAVNRIPSCDRAQKKANDVVVTAMSLQRHGSNNHVVRRPPRSRDRRAQAGSKVPTRDGHRPGD